MINKTSASTLEAIRRKSAQPLPNNPTEAGYKASEIKNAFYKPILDKENSVLSELNRVVDEINNNDYAGVANIKNFGAKGDGKTDDTVAVYKALQSNAERIYFPAGTYIFGTIGGKDWPDDWYFGKEEEGYRDDSMPKGKYLDDGLDVKSNKIIYGDGAALTIIKAPDYNQDKRIAESPANVDYLVPSAMFDLTDAENVVIRDICLDGNAENANIESRQKAIRFRRSNNITIENCEIKNFRFLRGSAIHTTESSENISIINNDIHECVSGIHLSKIKHVIVSNNHIYDLKSDVYDELTGGILINGTPDNYTGIHTYITDNVIENATHLRGIKVYHSDNIMIKNNTISNCSNGIWLTPVKDLSHRNIVVEGNYLYHNNIKLADGDNAFAEIYAGQTSNSVFKDNIIEAANEENHAIFEGSLSGQNTIINNVVRCGKITIGETSTYIDIKDFKFFTPDGYVNILDFGADPTGVNDSTDALESARTMAGTSGKGVYIPDGKFRVTRHYNITTNLLGNGDKSILYLEVDSIGFASNYAFRIHTGNPVKIEKIHFQTNGKVLNGSTANCVIINDSSDRRSEIRDCYFTGLSGNIRAIYLSLGTHIVSNNYVEDAEIAVAASNITSNLVIDHNTIVSSTMIGIYITDCPNPSLMIIKDNVITGDSSSPSILVRTTSGAVIMNNTVKMLSTVAPYEENEDCANRILYNIMISEESPKISTKSLYRSEQDGNNLGDTGDMKAAIDRIIAIQNSLIGGES